MHRFISLAIALTTIIALVMVMVIQPQQTTLQRKRLKNMRQFLLAQTGPQCPQTEWERWWEEPGGTCFTMVGKCAQSGQSPSFCETCLQNCLGFGFRSSGINSAPSSGNTPGGGNQGNLTPTQQLACFDTISQSLFGKYIKLVGVPTLLQPIIIQICAYSQNILKGKYGGDAIIVNEASNIIMKSITNFFLATPEFPENQLFQFNKKYEEEVGEYLKKGLVVLQEFEKLITDPTNFFANPKEYSVNHISNKLAAITPKLITKPAEELADIPEKIESLIIPPLLAGIPPTTQQTTIATTARNFIRTLETIYAIIRNQGIRRTAVRALNRARFFIDIARLKNSPLFKK